MNLAYMYSHGRRRTAALSPTRRGPLVAVPEWHYVRDVLMPQIEALPGGGRPAAPEPAPPADDGGRRHLRRNRCGRDNPGLDDPECAPARAVPRAARPLVYAGAWTPSPASTRGCS